jgi:hypothetical protein
MVKNSRTCRCSFGTGWRSSPSSRLPSMTVTSFTLPKSSWLLNSVHVSSSRCGCGLSTRVKRKAVAMMRIQKDPCLE